MRLTFIGAAQQGKCLGACVAVLGGAHGIVFSGGVDENAAAVRAAFAAATA